MTIFKQTASALLASTFLLGASLPVQADDDTGFYVGLGLVRSDADANDFDESENEVGVQAGYMFTDNLGIDFTFTNLSSADSDSGTDLDLDVLALSVIGAWPVTDTLDVYAKLGLAELSVDFTVDGEDISDTSDSEIFWAVGGKYDLGAWNLFLEYDRFDADDLDVNSLIAGVRYEF